jgi:hypothetical protein
MAMISAIERLWAAANTCKPVPRARLPESNTVAGMRSHSSATSRAELTLGLRLAEMWMDRISLAPSAAGFS